MQVGDKVKWIPSLDHAKDVLPDGTFAWEWVRTNRMNETSAVPAKELKKLFFSKLARAGRTASKVKALVPSKPIAAYDATVNTINPDGTVDLTITGSQAGIRYGYTGVKIDPAGSPGTCHILV